QPPVPHPTGGRMKLSLPIFLNPNTHSIGDSIDGPLLKALLHWVPIAKNLVKLLQSSILGFDKEEINDDSLNQVPKNEHEIEVIAELLEGGSATILNHSTCNIGSQISNGRSFRTSFSRQCLSDVHALQWCPSEAKNNSEEVNEGNCSVTGHFIV